MNRKKLNLYCFSPPVMLATFIIEICLAVYTVARYKLNEVGRVVVAVLVCLAIFQLAEYNVCAGGWIDAGWASRIGYVAITLLPPLGIHLAYALARAKKRPFMLPAYASAAGFALFFLTTTAITGNVCQGNYVIFQVMPDLVWLYALYYYGWLVVGMGVCGHLLTGQNRATQRALYALAAGYFVFMVPTTAANIINPETLTGIPSIMCGFAVLLALVLAIGVLPLRGEKR